MQVIRSRGTDGKTRIPKGVPAERGCQIRLDLLDDLGSRSSSGAEAILMVCDQPPGGSSCPVGTPLGWGLRAERHDRKMARLRAAMSVCNADLAGGIGGLPSIPPANFSPPPVVLGGGYFNQRLL